MWLLFIGSFFIVNNVFLAIYCRLARMAEFYATPNALNRYSWVKRKYISVIKYFYFHTYSFIYGWMRYCSLIVGIIPSNYVRKCFYKYIFAMKLTKKTVISGGCEFRSPWNIQLGNCVIQEKCLLDGRSGIVIGDNVVFGVGVHIWTQEHDVNDAYFAVNAEHSQSVIIKDYAWICSDSSILPGVVVEEGAVLASKALATKKCEAYGVYAGVPAKRISERNRDLKYVLSGKPHWHFY